MSMLLVLTLTGTLVQSAAPLQTGEVSGRVLEDGTQKPIADAQVTLVVSGPRSSPGSFFPQRPPTVMTDREGRYAVTGLEPGRYGVMVQKPGFAPEHEFRPREVEIRAGQRLTDVNLILQRGAAVVGRVLNEAGDPIVNAHVMAMRKPPVLPSGVRSMPQDILVPAGNSAQTNDLGEFRLFGLRAGEVYIQAMPQPDFGRSAAQTATTMIATYFPGTTDRAAAQPITVGPGETFGDITIRMVSAPAFQVSGVVHDESGRPVANAMVRLNAEDQGRPFTFMMGPGSESRTDASGKFTINNVIDGAYTLLAIPPVVVGSSHERRTGASASGAVSWIGLSAGGPNGPSSGHVQTETRDGTTIQYRDDAGTRVPITVNQANVSGIEVVVRTAGFKP